MSHERNETVNWAEMSIEDILELAIADEEYARDYYSKAAQLVGNLHTKRMLLKLADMELGHATELRKELMELRLEREEETGIAD